MSVQCSLQDGPVLSHPQSRRTPKSILFEVLTGLRYCTPIPDLETKHLITMGPGCLPLSSFCSKVFPLQVMPKDLGAVSTHETTSLIFEFLFTKLNIEAMQVPINRFTAHEFIYRHSHTHVHRLTSPNHHIAASWHANSWPQFFTWKITFHPQVPYFQSQQETRIGWLSTGKPARKPHLSHLLNFSTQVIWGYIPFSLSTETTCNYRRENTMRIRSCCGPFAQVFVHLVTAEIQVGKTGEAKRTQQEQSKPPQAKRHELFLEDMSPKFIFLGCDKIIFLGGKIAARKRTHYCTVCSWCCQFVNSLWNPVSSVGNRLPLHILPPKEIVCIIQDAHAQFSIS